MACIVYIDIDGAASGSTESAFGEGELVRFDPEHPWDYDLSVDGWSPFGAIKSADGLYGAAIQADWNVKLRRLTLRLDLSKAPRLLQSVLDGRPTWHYVLVGAYDGAREGHFAAVKPVANLHDGGGAKDDFSPRAYDLIASSGESQARELSSEEAARGILALLKPVAVDAAGAASSPDREKAAAEAAKADEREEADRKARLAALPESTFADSERLQELFSLGLKDRAMAAAKARLAKDPSDYSALAYRGALVALQAPDAATVGEKMRLVTAAYADLDAAVRGSASLDAKSRINVLLCRGNVSIAVPNDVFERAEQGAADFDAAKLLAKADTDDALEYSCLASSARALEEAGKDEDAKARWATLAAKPSEKLDPRLRLQLMDRGY
jgi:hypothetical protein